MRVYIGSCFGSTGQREAQFPLCVRLQTNNEHLISGHSRRGHVTGNAQSLGGRLPLHGNLTSLIFLDLAFVAAERVPGCLKLQYSKFIPNSLI